MSWLRCFRSVFADITVRHQPKDDLTPDRGTMSIKKARRLLGYEPRYPLERGFRRYINWYEQLLAMPAMAGVPM